MTTMPSTSSSYVQDVVYPDYFHRETMPLWLVSTLTANGWKAPDLHRPYHYLDLGCGGGLNLLIAAATNPLGHFVGIDINPDAISLAQQRAKALNLNNVRYECMSFEEALQHASLPPCDFIVSHGVYSWISPTSRAAFHQLVDKLLKPGGAMYLAYMSQPGSSSFAAAQKLLHQLGLQLPGSSNDKARVAFAWLHNLSSQGLGYFVEQPKIVQEIKRLTTQNHQYLAHEFLNPNWDSLHVADVCKAMESMQCIYAASANVIENLDALSLPAQALAHLQQLQQQGAAPSLQETFKDLARNQNQRRDLYLKAADSGMRLDAASHREQLFAQRVALIPGALKKIARSGDIFAFDTRIGPIEMPYTQVAPLLEALQQGPLHYADLSRLTAYQSNPGFINQLLQVLVSVELIGFAHDKTTMGSADVGSALNALLTHYPVGMQSDTLTGSMLLGSAYRT